MKKRHSWVALCAAAAVLALGAGAIRAELAPPEASAAVVEIAHRDWSNATPAKVVRVVDGDTVVLIVGGVEEHVRLVGVDTPETVHPQKPVEQFGKEASAFLKNLLDGEEVFLEYKPDERRDGYGRLLAFLFRAPDGLFVNLEIVRQGYGHAYTRYPFEYMDLFRNYEQLAREAKRGLWAEEQG